MLICNVILFYFKVRNPCSSSMLMVLVMVSILSSWMMKEACIFHEKKWPQSFCAPCSIAQGKKFLYAMLEVASCKYLFSKPHLY